VNKYFPNDEENLRFILSIYSEEIRLRAKWTISAAEEVNKKLEDNSPASEIIREAIDVINNAMSILRMIEKAGLAKKVALVEERINILTNRWNFPDPPSGLRLIRNRLEHFEENLDKWVVESPNHIHVDLHVGEPVGGVMPFDHFRRFEGDTFYFWGESVNLSEVCKWVQDVAKEVSN